MGKENFLKKIGKWNLVKKLTKNLKKIGNGAVDENLKKAKEKAFEIVTGHIDNQDLPWDPLKQKTKDAKAKGGFYADILVRTHLYRDSIEGVIEGKKVIVRITPGTTTNKGDDMNIIAAVHEFGSYAIGIPARPLWRPSAAEFREWELRENRLDEGFLRRIKRFVGL